MTERWTRQRSSSHPGRPRAKARHPVLRQGRVRRAHPPHLKTPRASQKPSVTCAWAVSWRHHEHRSMRITASRSVGREGGSAYGMLIVLRALEPIKTPRRGAKSAGVPEPTCAEAGKGGRRTRRGQLRTPVTPARRKVGTSGGQWVRSGRTSDERAEPPLETLMCAYRRVAQGISRVTSRPGRARHTCGRLRWTSRGRIDHRPARSKIHAVARVRKKCPKRRAVSRTSRRCAAGGAHDGARDHVGADARARRVSRVRRAATRANSRAHLARRPRRSSPHDPPPRRPSPRRPRGFGRGRGRHRRALRGGRVAHPTRRPRRHPRRRRRRRRLRRGLVSVPDRRGAGARRPRHAVPAADTATDTPIAGLVVAWVVADVEVQILEVAVHPTLRRRGLGARLVRAALDLAPAVDATLEVRASSDAALRLYESCGFSRVGERAGYYADGEDAVLMTRTPPVVSARELTRLLAGLSPEDARKPAPKTPEEKQRGETMHPQDYPRGDPRSEETRREREGARGVGSRCEIAQGVGSEGRPRTRRRRRSRRQSRSREVGSSRRCYFFKRRVTDASRRRAKVQNSWRETKRGHTLPNRTHR